MSGRQIRLDDAAIRDALLEEPRGGLAAEVAAELEASIARTPQDRSLVRLGAGWQLWTGAQGWARPMRVLVVAALVLATVIALLAVGSALPGPLPDNGLVVLGSDRAGLYLADPRTGERRQFVAPWQSNPSGRTNRSELVAIAPGGDRLAYLAANIGVDWAIRIIELPSGRPVDEIRDDGRGVLPEWGMRWSHDGSRLFLEATDQGLARIVAADLASGSVIDVGAADAASRDVAMSPVDGRAAFVQTSSAFGDDYRLVVWDPASGGTRELVGATADGHTAAAPAWAPDGQSLAVTVVRPDGTSAVARIGADGAGFAVLTPWSERWRFGQWSPDGTRLLVVDVPQGGRSADIYTDGGQRAELFLLERDGSDWRRLVADACSNAAWSPDASSILYERGTCDAGGPAEVRVIGADGTGDRAVWAGDAGATGRLSIGWQPIP